MIVNASFLFRITYIFETLYTVYLAIHFRAHLQESRRMLEPGALEGSLT